MAMAQAPAAQAPGAPAAGQPAVPEQSEFDVILASSGANKIGVIKAVREIRQDLGLKEAKELVEKTPQKLLERAKKEEAQEAKKKLVRFILSAKQLSLDSECHKFEKNFAKFKI